MIIQEFYPEILQEDTTVLLKNSPFVAGWGGNKLWNIQDILAPTVSQRLLVWKKKDFCSEHET